MTAGDIFERLVRLRPLYLEAVTIYARMQANPSEAEIAELQPRIEAAVTALVAHSTAAERLVARCTQLPPAPSRWAPTGF